jgi:hypothetical protein
VVLDSCFVHSNDYAVAVKATTPSTRGRVLDTLRVTISIGLSRIVALYYRSSTLYQIH